MPRRIRLDLDQLSEGHCDLCGEASTQLLTQYRTRNFGVSYEGWEHVLSPHSRESADKPKLPVHGQPGGIGFRHWVGIVMGDVDGTGKGRIPAKVVAYASRQTYRRRLPAAVLAFGYDMDNMKARAWVESRMPLHQADEDHQDAFEGQSRTFIHAANEAFLYLRSMVKSALHGTPTDNEGKLKWDFPPSLKVDTAFFDSLAGDFWRQGEPLFFHRLRELLQCLDNEGKQQECGESWLKDLEGLATRLFDQAVGGVEEADNRVMAVVYARRQLGFMLRGNALRKLMYLPEHPGKDGKTNKKGGKRG
jgi:CRISPR system Cascade subunit CasA